MNGVVVIDTPLMVLLIVGTASRAYISRHKRLKAFSVDDFDMLGQILSQFSEMVLLPHILSEVSGIARQIDGPARARVQLAFRKLIASCAEMPVPSITGTQRQEFDRLGLTDAVILHLCAMNVNGISPTLLTTDTELADNARSLGYSVIDYKQEFQSE